MTCFPIAALGVSVAVLGVLAMSCGLARAQLVLPGAAPAPLGAPAGAPAARKSEKATANFASGAADIVGRPLRLNGNAGQLLFSGHGKVLRIDKFSLPGEVISDPSRKCLIDIVGDAPIEAKSLGTPDGLARYEAEIPACLFSFDLLDGAVLVPAQNTACVFQAADCQASPGGLWGPDGANLENDAKSIERQRARADAAAAGSLRTLQARLKGQPEADDMARDEGDFPAQRDDVCRDYEKEAVHGYCASRMAQAHAAHLKARIDALERRPAAQD
ncbi:MAG: hypothetical protein ABSA66_07295 [Roseiarcus sp.]|jgi:hypothetical protein